MDYTSFSHGQIHSKLWLCEELEKFLPSESNLYILGSWYNTLGFMLLCRNPHNYKSITAIDIDSTQEIADKLTDAWTFDPMIVKNVRADASKCDFHDSKAVYINCSVEHFQNTEWFNNIPEGALICLQSISITDPEEPWLIRQPNATFDEFAKKYPITNTLFSGTKRIQYSDWGYDRFMLIGYR